MTSPSIISRICEKASEKPFAKALVSKQESIDYQSLDAQSNQLARALQLRGVTTGSLVGIVLDRSPQFVIAALAVWKAGAAYVPVDPSYPAQRITLLLKDAGVPVVVTSRACQPDTSTLSFRLLLVDDDRGFIASQPSGPIETKFDEQALAYVIYTSGSTGTPNGVEVTHRNVAHLCNWHWNAFGVTELDRAMFAASPGFDAAVWEIWPYLAVGASLHLPDDMTRRSPELLRDWLVANDINIAFAATPLAEAMLTLDWPTKTSLRTLLTGADTLHRFPVPGLPFELVNNYGPTECTVVSTSGSIPAKANGTGRPSIGRPVTNAVISILDAERKPVPAGTEGEIYIGGDGVARGYRNRPELTAARFKNGLYKTGDAGRLLPNGEIEFLGRTDEQIKIRGYRIEPGEIVSALDRHPEIRCSAVVLSSKGCDARLVAYLVPRGDSPTFDLREIQSFLQPNLPEHMVPATFVILNDLPTTSHGKVDRSQLPEPSPSNTLRNAEVSAASPIQEQVTTVLSSLLKRSNIALDDNFFMLGGHSLLGTQLIIRLRELFGVDLNLLTLFDNPTARSLSAEVERLLVDQLDTMSEAELSQLAD